MWNFELIPEQASTVARRIDSVYFVLVGLSSLIILGIVVAITYFAIKYRHQSTADRSNPTTSNVPLELTWIVIPFFLSIGVFVWAAGVFFEVNQPPEGTPLEIYTIGKQWMWKFQHPNGAREINALHVPVGRPVKLIMTSQDVIHSFYVPAFRVKHDVLPDRYTNVWFEATKTGRFHLFCTEYCGTDHSDMTGYVQVMQPADYQEWLEQGATGGSQTEPGSGRYERTPTGPLEDPSLDREDRMATPPDADAEMLAAGRQLFQALQCQVCHRVDSTALRPSTGPPLEGLYGRTVTLQNGREVVADEQYLRESILYPQNALVQGYPAIMPTFQGQISEDDLVQLIAYLKSLSDEPGDADTP